MGCSNVIEAGGYRFVLTGDESGFSEISSNLSVKGDYFVPACVIEATILAQYNEGIDVFSRPYARALETVIDAICNNL